MTPNITAGVDELRVVGTALVAIAPFSVVLFTWLRAVAGDNGKTILQAVFTAQAVLALAVVVAVVSWYTQKGYADNWFSVVLVAWYALTGAVAAGHTNLGYALLTSEKRTRRYGGAKLFALPTPQKS